MANRHYSIYADCCGRLALHRSGFSWIAALFPPLWAVPRRLWLACLGWLMINLIARALLLELLAPHLPLLGLAGFTGIGFGAFLIQSWVIGRFANPFHHWWLHRHGYVLIATAPSPEGDAA
jgi:hypothetical protein